MVKKIKFRMWSEEEKQYIKGFICTYDKGSCVFLDATKFCNGKISPLIPEQSTGFKDMDGNEIWVGDIIRDFDDEILIVETAGSAYVSDKTCAEQHWDDWEKNSRYSRLRCLEKLWLDTGYYKDAGTQIKVIGNIHKNPELLEAKW